MEGLQRIMTMTENVQILFRKAHLIRPSTQVSLKTVPFISIDIYILNINFLLRNKFNSYPTCTSITWVNRAVYALLTAKRRQCRLYKII